MVQTQSEQYRRSCSIVLEKMFLTIEPNRYNTTTTTTTIIGDHLVTCADILDEVHLYVKIKMHLLESISKLNVKQIIVA